MITCINVSRQRGKQRTSNKCRLFGQRKTQVIDKLDEDRFIDNRTRYLMRE